MATLSELVTGRIPPNSVEAERAVLGSVLLDRSGLALAIELLIPDDFYFDKHRKIFAVAVALFERGDEVDLLTAAQELQAQGLLEDVQGPPYLAGLIEEAAVLAHLKSYIEIVREKAMAREMIRAAVETIGLSYEGRKPVTEILEMAERSLFAIADRQYVGTIMTVGAALRDAFEYIERQAESRQMITGLPSGLYDLDLITSGFQRQDLILVGGRPSSGKTVFAMGVASAAALDGKRVLVFSLEMATRQLTLRLLSAEARVDNTKIRTGFLEGPDWTRLVSAGGRLAEANLSIDDSATLTPLELRAKARRFKANGGLDLIVVDYLQLMGVGGGRRENRQQEITTISRSLKAIAKEMDCPVLVLSQLTRAVESREKKEPVISDLRECLARDQVILDSNSGEWVTVQDIAGRSIVGESGGTFVSASVSECWSNGRKPVFLLRTRSGRTLRATANHPLLTFDGWRQLGGIRIGERIAVPRMLPAPSKPENVLSVGQVRLLGYLISDGHYGRHRSVGYVKADLACVAEVEQLAFNEFGVIGRRKRQRTEAIEIDLSMRGTGPNKNPLIQWLKQLGIHGQLGPAKTIPAEIFRSDNRIVAEFIATLWAGDGTVVQGKHAALKFTSTSMMLLQQLHSLLSRFGIVSILERSTRHTKSTVDIATLRIVDRENMQRFRAAFILPGVKQARLDAVVDRMIQLENRGRVDRLPIQVTDLVAGSRRGSWSQLGYRCQEKEMSPADLRRILPKLTNQGAFTRYVSEDIMWDRVVSISPDGVDEVYDFSVPAIGNLVASNILVHNSGAIEQDADLVLLLYRPLMYGLEVDGDSDSEIIIGKHRNGRIGRVKVAFVAEYSSFQPLSRRTEVF